MSIEVQNNILQGIELAFSVICSCAILNFYENGCVDKGNKHLGYVQVIYLNNVPLKKEKASNYSSETTCTKICDKLFLASFRLCSIFLGYLIGHTK